MTTINADASVSMDLTGLRTQIAADHTADAWGRPQVTLTLSATTDAPVRPKATPRLHVRVNAVDLRSLVSALTEAADVAERLHAEHRPQRPLGIHGG